MGKTHRGDSGPPSPPDLARRRAPGRSTAERSTAERCARAHVSAEVREGVRGYLPVKNRCRSSTAATKASSQAVTIAPVMASVRVQHHHANRVRMAA